MGFVRQFAYVFLALLVGSSGIPVVAVTCVPSVPCAGMREGCPRRAVAERPLQVVMESPDCCEQSVREHQLAAVTGAKLQEVAPQAEVPAAGLAVPPALPQIWQWTLARPPTTSVPLYTLHSILLI